MNSDNKVIDISVFNSENPDADLLNSITNSIGATYSVPINEEDVCIGAYYLEGRFTSIKNYDSWILDPVSYKWVAPVACPGDEILYNWDEENQSWTPRFPELA